MLLFSVDKVICSILTRFQPMEVCVYRSIIGMHANTSRHSTPLSEEFLEAADRSFNEGVTLDFGAPLYSKTNVCGFDVMVVSVEYIGWIINWI